MRIYWRKVPVSNGDRYTTEQYMGKVNGRDYMMITHGPNSFGLQTPYSLSGHETLAEAKQEAKNWLKVHGPDKPQIMQAMMDEPYT